MDWIVAKLPDPKTSRRVWRLAGPIILANLTVPLLGAVDTAVVGHLPDPAYLGGVAIGALVFSYIYWGFGFLKMGTTGLTAQAWGREDGSEIRLIYLRASAIAVGLGCVIAALQAPIISVSFYLLNASDTVESFGAAYVAIRIWGAPAALMNYVILGWCLGMQDARTPLYLQLFINSVNIVLDLVFVVGFGWGVEGVAAATLIAECAGALLGALIIWRRLGRLGGARASFERVFQWIAFRALIVLNTDILIRTLCLTTAFAVFTAQGALFGDVILAANAVLLNFFSFTAYGLDGFAHAAEALVGGAKGRRDRRGFVRVANAALAWGAVVAVLSTLAFWALGGWIVNLLTSIPEVRQASHEYLLWAILMPIVSVWCFVLDGIFIGATRSAALRNAMVVSLGGFLVILWPMMAKWENHGLWAAISVFLILRAVTLWAAYPALLRAVEPPDQAGRRNTATASK